MGDGWTMISSTDDVLKPSSDASVAKKPLPEKNANHNNTENASLGTSRIPPRVNANKQPSLSIMAVDSFKSKQSTTEAYKLFYAPQGRIPSKRKFRHCSKVDQSDVAEMEDDMVAELEHDLFHLIEQTIKLDYQRRKRCDAGVLPSVSDQPGEEDFNIGSRDSDAFNALLQAGGEPQRPEKQTNCAKHIMRSNPSVSTTSHNQKETEKAKSKEKRKRSSEEHRNGKKRYHSRVVSWTEDEKMLSLECVEKSGENKCGLSRDERASTELAVLENDDVVPVFLSCNKCNLVFMDTNKAWEHENRCSFRGNENAAAQGKVFGDKNVLIKHVMDIQSREGKIIDSEGTIFFRGQC